MRVPYATLPVVLALAGAAVGATRSASAEGGLGAPSRAADRVQPNDNRQPGGAMRGGVLVLRLQARVAVWHPDGDAAPGAPVSAFAEEGGAARIPGPLVRVRAGTVAEVHVHNALRDTLLVHGLHARTGDDAAAPPLVLAPDERRAVRLRLDAPGTYYYWGTTTRRSMDFRTLEDAQLTGAIVVDGGVGSARDRVFVIGMWTDTVHRARTHRHRVLAVLNGRSWPHTERLRHAVGDSVRWRVINASADLHPMHLHGFYFRVDSRGDGRRDTVYAAGARRPAVTESMASGATMSLTWVPERPGNWLYHCHIPEHFAPRAPLGLARAAAAGPADHADHATGGMNGLVMGVEVRPAPGPARAAASDGNARRLRLLVRPNHGGTVAAPFYAYALHEAGAEPPPDSGLRTGPTLDLERGRPVRITIVNRLPDPTAVHWHGIELDSYFDGVPGFSGAGSRLTPLIAPGDSFVVRFTPPRAGTFIYHTHADEIRQQLAGLAGALVVRERGTVRDPATDVPVLISETVDSAGGGSIILVNGHAEPAPLRLRVGTTYRLRLIQLAVSRSVVWTELRRDGAIATWRPVAKDGAALPASARPTAAANVRLGIGETYDVEVTPEVAGDLRLEVRSGVVRPLPTVLLATLPITVLPAARPAPARRRTSP